VPDEQVEGFLQERTEGRAPEKPDEPPSPSPYPARSEPPSSRTVFRSVIVVILSVLLVVAAYRVRSVLILALVALFLAVGLDPAVRRLHGLGMRRSAAIGTIFAGVVVVMTAFVVLLVPPMLDQVVEFGRNLPGFVQRLADENPQIREWVDDNDISAQLEGAVSNIPAAIGGSLTSVLGVAGSVASGIFNVVTVVILTIYFSIQLLDLHQGVLKLVPRSRRARVAPLLDRMIGKVGGYIAGQVTVALIAGVTAVIFLTVVRVPFSVALGMFVAFAALIPMIGATLGAIPACAVALLTSLPRGLVVVAFFVVYQQLENTMISPRVMTKAVDLSPAAVLLAALVGATLLGFVGALMAIPAAASIKIVFQEVVYPMAERS
jgi:predicted PurR-regulated permease PerM